MPRFAFIRVKIFVYLFATVCSALLGVTFIKEVPWQDVINQLEAHTQNFPQEKVHIHTDKPFYALGEDIWLKAYVVIAANNKLSGISKVLHVDLVDENNEVKNSSVFELNGGVGHGSILLKDSLKAGRYSLRAYTKYMLNYDHDFMFEKTVIIGDAAQIEEQKKEIIEKNKLEVLFFPEGGNFVNGLRSKVGIKAVLYNGLGTSISGKIVTLTGREVIGFKTQHAGMGITAFTPESGEHYKAEVEMPDGSIKTFVVPEALKEGHVISVNGVENEVLVAVNRNVVKKGRMYVIAQSGGRVYTSFGIDSNKNTITVKIPESTFPTGIVQFTLFDASNIPVAERLYFVNNNDQLRLEPKQLTETLLVKKKAVLALQVSDFEGRPAEGNFSVSVTDLGKVPSDEDGQQTVLSNLLLTSDLKGYIERPNYYFSSHSLEKRKQLDNLMLTQGWRRFKWTDIIEKRYPELKLLPEQGIEISGIASTLGGKAVP